MNILLIAPLSIFSQTIVSEGSSKYKLESVVEVEVFQQKDCAQCYYYLPTNLSLAYKESVPQISLMKWDAEGDTEAGAILHFLIKWELSKKQQTHLQFKISSFTEDKAIIMGSVNVESSNQEKFFFGEDPLVELLNINLNNRPLLSTTPGAKMAFSFKFNGEDVKQLLERIKNINKSDAQIELAYFYEINNQREVLNLKLDLKKLFVHL